MGNNNSSLYYLVTESHTNDEYDMYINITDDDIPLVYVYAVCNIVFVYFQGIAMNRRRR